MSGHTPGPWKVIETNYLPHNGDHVADMSNGLMVVPCLSGLGDPLADARLIAAAPLMLSELRKARAALKEHLDELIKSHTHPATGLIADDADLLPIDSVRVLINGIDRVIAKAEGRAAG